MRKDTICCVDCQHVTLGTSYGLNGESVPKCDLLNLDTGTARMKNGKCGRDAKYFEQLVKIIPVGATQSVAGGINDTKIGEGT